jgi:ribosomal protein S18 acetylase RimI-like enzyme
MPKQDVHIRNLTPDDYDRLAEIWTQAGLSFRPDGRDGREYVQSEMERDSAIFLGAEVDGELVAVVLGTHDGRKGWINRLAVLPEYQKRGIAKALTVEVERRLNDAGILIVTCLIEGDNQASREFFQSLGYIGHPDITYYSKRQSSDW